MSSAYKRHGFIIERAILEQLRLNPDFEVWEDKSFFVPSTADHIVDSAIGEPEHIFGSETAYREGPELFKSMPSSTIEPTAKYAPMRLRGVPAYMMLGNEDRSYGICFAFRYF